MSIGITKYHARTFVDLPAQVRLQVRDAISDWGGEVADYSGNGITVYQPAGHESERIIDAILAGVGFVPVKSWWFPLGSWRAPLHLRHHGQYRHLGNGPGFSLSTHYQPGGASL